MSSQYEKLRDSYKEALGDFEEYMNKEFSKKKTAYKDSLKKMIESDREKEKGEHDKRINEDKKY